MNTYGISAIYRFELARWFRTLVQSLLSPVISTSLYFVVFGAAIGSRMTEVDGVPYGAFIVPGLIMLSLFTQSIFNASFGIFFPKRRKNVNSSKIFYKTSLNHMVLSLLRLQHLSMRKF